MSKDLNPLHPNHIEGLCKHTLPDQMQSLVPATGIELLRARFGGHAYDKHSHDTYAIGLTDAGVQSFDYRGESENSTAGRVIVLHPGEVHNGRAGSDAGFSYRMLYIDPGLISQALQSITGRACPLPFVKKSVSDNLQLASAINFADAYAANNQESMVKDEVILQLTEGLVAADPACIKIRKGFFIDYLAVNRAREFIAANKHRVIDSQELEIVTGLNRFELTRHFKKVLGCSPYRYSLNRRLDRARQLLHTKATFTDVAYGAGFSDQAHLCRLFKSRFGLTPGQYYRINSPASSC